MADNNDSSSSPTPSHLKTNNREQGQRNYRNSSNYSNYSNYNNYNNYNDNLDSDEWKFFIWLASLRRFENYTHLFIVIWDSTKLEGAERSEEFNDEIGQMKSYIEDLFTNSAINKETSDKYSSLLDNFRNFRYNNPEAERNLVSHAFSKLERIGLGSYNNQLYKLKYYQKKKVRQMILNRMRSFVSITSREEDELKKEIEDLREQNTHLVRENTQYQAVLGNMKNTRLSDQDPNNATKLNSDIMELQHLLEEFTTVSGPEYKINEETSTELLSQNNQNNYQLSNPTTRLVLGGILQQRIITQVLNDVNSYFNNYTENRDPDDTIEVDILNTTEKLIQSVNYLNEKRPGSDVITQAVPTKVRQIIYAGLGCRGFSNDDHPLIVETAKKICELMNKYRKITDPDILNETDDQSIQITRKLISIFYFRLKTQQNIPTYHFFRSGDEIDTRFMQVSSSSREEAKKSEVEVCYFPCIGILDNNNPSNNQIITKAQVYSRQKKQNSTNGSGGIIGKFKLFDKK